LGKTIKESYETLADEEKEPEILLFTLKLGVFSPSNHRNHGRVRGFRAERIFSERLCFTASETGTGNELEERDIGQRAPRKGHFKENR